MPHLLLLDRLGLKEILDLPDLLVLLALLLPRALQALLGRLVLRVLIRLLLALLGRQARLGLLEILARLGQIQLSPGLRDLRDQRVRRATRQLSRVRQDRPDRPDLRVIRLPLRDRLGRQDPQGLLVLIRRLQGRLVLLEPPDLPERRALLVPLALLPLTRFLFRSCLGACSENSGLHHR